MGQVANNYPEGCFWLLLAALINIIGGSKRDTTLKGSRQVFINSTGGLMFTACLYGDVFPS